jgi:hypothetical protein
MAKKKIEKISISRNTNPAPFLIVEIDGTKKELDIKDLPKLTEVESIEVVGVFHLVDAAKRCELIKWLYRSLVKDGKAVIVGPHWSHGKAYMDPGVVWPPLTAEFFFLTDKDHRTKMAPHVKELDGVDFRFIINGAWDPNDTYVAARNQETKMVFMHRNINTTTDILVTLTKK